MRAGTSAQRVVAQSIGEYIMSNPSNEGKPGGGGAPPQVLRAQNQASHTTQNQSKIEAAGRRLIQPPPLFRIRQVPVPRTRWRKGDEEHAAPDPFAASRKDPRDVRKPKKKKPPKAKRPKPRFDKTLGFPGEGPRGARRGRGARGQRPQRDVVLDIKEEKEVKEEKHLVPDVRPEEIVVLFGAPDRERASGFEYFGLLGRSFVKDFGNGNFFTVAKPMRKVPEVRYPSQVVRVAQGFEEVHPGYYKKAEDPDVEVFFRPAFSLEVEPGVPDLEIEPGEFLVCQPFYLELMRKFPSAHLSESNFRGFTANACRDWPTLPLKIKIDTVNYFASQVHRLQRGVLTKDNAKRIIERANLGLPGRAFSQPPGHDSLEELMCLGQNASLGAFFRLYSIRCEVEKNTTNNGNFVLVKSVGYRADSADTIAGRFNTDRRGEISKRYKTVFFRFRGPVDFRLYDDISHNITLAMSRMYKARPQEDLLQANQLKLLAGLEPEETLVVAVSNDPQELKASFQEEPEAGVDFLARQAVREFFTTLQPAFYYRFLRWLVLVLTLPLYLMCAFFARIWYVFTPRPKTALYQKWFFEVGLYLGHSYEIGIDDPIEARLKNEFAKPGKHGRLYVSYGRSILYAGWIYEHFKSVFCGTYTFGCGEVQSWIRRFIGPTYHLDEKCMLRTKLQVVKALDEKEDVEKFFEKDDGLFIRVYSDDMTSRYRSAGLDLLWDSDISSCDSGNGSAMFYLLGLLLYVMGFGMYVATLFRRLKAPITLFNPENRKEFIKVQPKTIFEGSGSPETTPVNHVASTAISISTSVYLWYYSRVPYEHEGQRFKFSDPEAPAAVRTEILKQAAAAVGHEITVNWCEMVAQTQFLKYSPLTAVDGLRKNTRNYGTIFRSLGAVDGDLTAVQLGMTKSQFRLASYSTKMERFVGGVIEGLKHEPRSIIMDALRQRFPPTGSTNIPPPSFNMDTSERSNSYIPTESLIERYGGCDAEYQLLAEQILKVCLGDVIYSPLVAKFLSVDYGLE